VNPKKRRHAYVSVAGLRVDILIDGEKDRNRAFHGDFVCVELHGEQDWAEIHPSTLRERLGKSQAQAGVDKLQQAVAGLTITSGACVSVCMRVHCISL
jgi:exoribonuclease R